MKKKLVEILWVDAEADSGWTEDDPQGDSKVALLRTYGLLVRKTKDYVVHASTYDPHLNRWCDKGKIPRGMVKAIRIIETVSV